MYTVTPLAASAAHDRPLVDRLTALVNAVYLDGERGLWRDGADRTDAAEMARFVADGQVTVALAADGEGMLAAAFAHRGTGVGRALVDRVEDDRRARGDRAMQLELLVPRTGTHPAKERLKAWYGRRGYRLLATRCVDAAYPHLAPRLAVPCDLLVHEKPLRSPAPAR